MKITKKKIKSRRFWENSKTIDLLGESMLPIFKKLFRFAKPETEIKDSPLPSPPIHQIEATGGSLYTRLSLTDENPDEILKKQGINIYEEMENKDPHIYSVYQTRKLAVSRIPWDILPADDSDESKEMAEFVLECIDNCEGIFSEDIFQLMDAIGKGFSILEIIWHLIEKGKWKGKYGIKELVFHKQKFWFFKDKRWHKTKEPVFIFKDVGELEGEEVPSAKIIHYAFDAQDSMYGRAAFRPIFWFYFFKKENWKWWIIFEEKYGAPTALGKYPEGTGKPEQDKLLDVLEALKQESSIIIPDSLDVSFLEASHSGPASFRQMSDACNAEISKAILGATQTVEEGRRGSYALSRAHSEVRLERVSADAIEIADTIQQQLVKRLIDFNFITDTYPQFIMRHPAYEKDHVSSTKQKPKKFQESLTILTKDLETAIIEMESDAKESILSGKAPAFNPKALKKALEKQVSEEEAFELAGYFRDQLKRNFVAEEKEPGLRKIFAQASEKLKENFRES